MSESPLQDPAAFKSDDAPAASNQLDAMAKTLDAGHAFAEASVENATGARILMARKLADLIVLPVGYLDANERSLTGDILVQVLDKVDYDLRIAIAERVAGVPEIPENLLIALLTDTPDVAEPILTRTDDLSDALLITCARQGEPAHRKLIARRFGLSTAVCDAVLEFDEPDTAKLLMRRDDCVLSQTAIEKLVSRSTVDEQFQQLLIERRELEPAHGFMLFWWVNSEGRKRLLSRFALDRSQIQDALRPLYPVIALMEQPDPLVEEILTLNERRHRPRGLDGETVSMDVVKRTLALSRQYPSGEIIEALSMIAGISTELTARILRDPGGEPYAVLCKSLGVPRLEFLEFLATSGAGIYDDGSGTMLGEDRAEDLLDVFDRMARDTSRAILRYWDWGGNPRIERITKLLSQNRAGFDTDL